MCKFFTIEAPAGQPVKIIGKIVDAYDHLPIGSFSVVSDFHGDGVHTIKRLDLNARGWSTHSLGLTKDKPNSTRNWNVAAGMIELLYV